MQTPPNLNDQHLWGGQRFGTRFTSPATIQERTPREGRVVHPDVGVTASSSDTLFHPVLNNPFPSSYVYNLPEVPLNPRFRASHHSPFTRPLPYPSSSTSYNNPTFTIPPPNSHTQAPPLPHMRQMGPPPPLPPRLPSHSVSHIPQSQFQPVSHIPQFHFQYRQPTYTHPPPAFDQFLPSDHLVRPLPPLPSFSSPSFSVVPSASKTLPNITHIPILTLKSDFFPWDEGVHVLGLQTIQQYRRQSLVKASQVLVQMSLQECQLFRLVLS